MRHFADHIVFPCSFYVLSETAIPLYCALFKLYGLDYCSGGPSVVAQKIRHQTFHISF